MATVKNIDIQENWKVINGENYNLIKFSINELNKPYYWTTSFEVKADTSEERVRELVEECAKQITTEEIKEYREFLEDGEKWGWD